MEERQLATVSSLERRCENLEAECCSLKSMMSSLKESQLRQHEYNNMLVRNQNWKYSAPVRSKEHYENNMDTTRIYLDTWQQAAGN
jgi:hypothetical protein